MRLKVMTIVGTRPEIIKLCMVLKELDQYTDHVLVHTGQNFDYELNEIFFEQLGIRKPDYYMNAAGRNATATIGNVIAKSDELFEKEQPDALLVYGDTNSCLSVISAKKRQIPIFHMEAGNRCFDQRVPEEINRKIVDHLSDVNMTITEHARRYLMNEGIRPETIIKVGSSMQEVFHKFMPAIEESNILNELKLVKGSYFVVSMHREENVDSPDHFHDFMETLEGLASTYKQPIIVSTHPRTRKKLESLGIVSMDSLVRFMKPLGFMEYNHLQLHAKCVISDSGTLTEESSLLNFPAITIRNAHERPEGMDEGVLVMSGLRKERVLSAVEMVTTQSHMNSSSRVVQDYDSGKVSEKVSRIIMSYTDYINRTVWYK